MKNFQIFRRRYGTKNYNPPSDGLISFSLPRCSPLLDGKILHLSPPLLLAKVNILGEHVKDEGSHLLNIYSCQEGRGCVFTVRCMGSEYWEPCSWQSWEKSETHTWDTKVMANIDQSVKTSLAFKVDELGSAKLFWIFLWPQLILYFILAKCLFTYFL